jgi:Ca-activated chloride channel family protein
MKRSRLKPIVVIAVLATVAAAMMSYRSWGNNAAPADRPLQISRSDILTLGAHLVQGSVLLGSDGRVGFELTLSAAEVFEGGLARARGIDLVVVLDRSGSMQGPKMDYARQALRLLLAGLTEADRLALVSYADGVQQHFDLLAASEGNRPMMLSAVNSLFPAGSTNLGAGLQSGIALLRSGGRPGHAGRVVLISDGLANRGVTDPAALAGMAAAAAGSEFAVSTIGVGSDFNEHLMTRIADRGAGTYYYLDNPSAFAETFQKEFLATRAEAATGLTVSVVLPPGVRLAEAAGYPVAARGETAVFFPGGLRSGQTRRLFLTFQVPTASERAFEIGPVSVRYQHGGSPHEVSLTAPFTIACVGDETRVFSSIDRLRWEEKVIADDYNRLKQDVAADLRDGNTDEALSRIDAYAREQAALNSALKSPAVQKNLDTDVTELKRRVGEITQAPAASRAPAAKALQFEGYSGRRSQ